MNRKIVVTGLGCINCASNNVDEFWCYAQDGKSGLKSNYPDEITDDNIMNSGGFVSFVEKGILGERTTQLAYIAAKQAINNAGISNDIFKMGLSFGTSIGGYEGVEGYLRNEVYSPKSLDPAFTTNYLAKKFNLCGPLITNAAACAASSNSFGSALQAINMGMCDCMLVGGADPVSYMSQTGFVALKAMTKEYCRPFNEKTFTGIQIGEGAAFLVIETLSSAKKRGAEIFAEVVGYGCCNEAYHETAPDPQAKGAIISVKRALAMAKIDFNKIDYINMHGTGTKLNDAMEIMLLNSFSSEMSRNLRVSSIKGTVGHMLGCAGATEALITVLALKNQQLPVNSMLKEPMDKDIPLVNESNLDWNINYAMSNSFAFGGNASSVIFSKYSE